jgi:histidinol phosphate phosphatase HisJ family
MRKVGVEMKNYHTHTYRCHHAIGKEEEYVQKAIEGGYEELGFSDHTPWHYKSHFVSSMRMREEELDGYISSLKKLREKYKNQISIKIGLEVEYFEKYIPWLKKVIKKKDIDYIILGNHFDGSDEYGIYYGMPIEYRDLVKYVDGVIKGIDTGLFSYVAHPDLACFDSDDKRYVEEYRRLCIHAKKKDIPLEFNLLGYKTNRHYPNPVFWQLVSQIGNKAIIGTDAHEPYRLNDRDTYNQAIEYLNQLGVEITEDIKFFR